MSEMPVPDVFTLPVVKCPSCGRGIDPHRPSGICGVGADFGACPCLWTPNDIAGTLIADLRAKVEELTSWEVAGIELLSRTDVLALLPKEKP